MECDQTYKGRCNFEHGLCPQWQNDPSAKIPWRLSSSHTATAGTGPLGDHTTRTSSGKCVDVAICKGLFFFVRLTQIVTKTGEKN